MTEKEQQDRVSKREFLAQVANSADIPLRTVSRVYDAMLAEMMDTMRRGDQLMLTGFGKFYPQAHKGHRVQFAEDGSKEIPDYLVLKFSATRSVNKALLEKPSRERTPGSGEYDGEDVDDDFGEDETSAKTKRSRGRNSSAAAVSLAAAATKSSRAINRAHRQVVNEVLKEVPVDRAV